jgi:manganese transport protein
VRREGIDMLVVGGHGHRGLFDWLYGETITSIRHHLSIPIFAVRE